MAVYVNRLLNMKKIKLIGFDMDYTLVRYNTEAFETLTHRLACGNLIGMGYPNEVNSFQFDIKRSIGGLVIDNRNGNILKLSRFGKVKIARAGMDEIDYREQRKLYQDLAIDLSDPDFKSLDTAFAISQGVLFAQLVELKRKGVFLPDYGELAADVERAVDMAHQNGSLKGEIVRNFEKYVIREPEVALLMERFLNYGKKLMIITNSDYSYTRKLLDYTINPYLKEHKRWEEVFEIAITLADKPAFFKRSARFLNVKDKSGSMTNHFGKIGSGVYQGGWFGKLQEDMGIPGREILYIGDHIYGDVVSIKKQCDWRTALVLEDLEKEVDSLRASKPLQDKIDRLMNEKAVLEKEINLMDIKRHEGGGTDRKKLDRLFNESDKLNKEISALLGRNRDFFNPYWGEILRAGNDESRFADQVERYACIYMTRVSDLYDYSPNTYFRPERRKMPHEASSFLL